METVMEPVAVTVATIQGSPHETSYTKSIGINLLIFENLMRTNESSVNRVCSENKVVYLCNSSSVQKSCKLCLLIIGCDESHVCQAYEELLKLIPSASIENVRQSSSQHVDAEISHNSCVSENRVSTAASRNNSPTSKNSNSKISRKVSPATVRSKKTVQFCTQNSIIVKFSCDDLVRQKTEAIACLTNNKLNSSQMSSKAVIAAVGCRHAKDCRSFLQSCSGLLKPCDVMHTDAGNLWPSVHHILHVIEPRPEELGDPQQQHMLLEDLYFNCLQYANNKLESKSIALPVVTEASCNVIGPVIASAVCKALIKFDQLLKDSSSLREVNFVCLDEKTLDVLTDMFKVLSSQLQKSRSLEPSNDDQQLTERTERHNSRSSLHRQDAVNEDRSSEMEDQPELERDDTCWWKSRIKSNYDSLQLEMSFENGFEGELLKLNAFDRVVLERAREKSSSPLKIKHLLDNLLQGNESMFDQFCVALNSSRQDHILTKYLSADSPIFRKRHVERFPRSTSEPTFRPDMRLLEPWKLQNLRTFRNELVQQIISDVGLLSHLRAQQVFTDHQLAEVEAEKHETSRNEMILQWLEKSSEGTHTKLCDALTRNNQMHLVYNYLLKRSHSMVESRTLKKHNRNTTCQ